MKISPISTPPIPPNFHKTLRANFHARLQSALSSSPAFASSISLFKGIVTLPKNNEDTNHYVEQESTFWYLFGVKEPDCYAVIHNVSGEVTLFVPRLQEGYKMWMYVKPVEVFREEVGAKEVKFVDELKQYLLDLSPSQIYIYSGIDQDSKLPTDNPDPALLPPTTPTNTTTLYPLINNLRVIKTQQQIELLRYICNLTTQSHIKVMKSCRPGLTQIQMHALFNFQHTVNCGCKSLAFDSICSSGRDCATLHYIENDKVLQKGQLVLHDMGGKWYGYCADQAITFPIDGKFNDKQKIIYVAVYEAQLAVLKTMKPGVSWTDMHLLAERVIIEHLIEAGIINKFPVEEIQAKRIGAIFFPHGLGHLLGLRVHDVGGYSEGEKRSTEAGLRCLRTRRILEEGMVLTVEPGCYFIDFIIENALKDPEQQKYLNQDKIKEFMEVGGVRLEDNVVVRKDGPEMLSFLPRKWEDVEKILAQE